MKSSLGRVGSKGRRELKDEASRRRMRRGSWEVGHAEYTYFGKVTIWMGQ